jgi:hypothetical protein
MTATAYERILDRLRNQGKRFARGQPRLGHNAPPPDAQPHPSRWPYTPNRARRESSATRDVTTRSTSCRRST